VACKTWLSGGQLICDRRTWFAHLFRTQGGDFGFPYPLSGQQVERAREYSRRLWLGSAWPGAVRPLVWLLEHFWPVPGWTEGDLAQLRAETDDARRDLVRTDSREFAVTRAERQAESPVSMAALYYTDNRLDPLLMEACQKQLESCLGGRELVSVSLRPIAFGHNIVTEGERGPLTLFRQILAGLEAVESEMVYFCEHDVLYHPAHFAFAPPDEGLVYYDSHFWQVDLETGRALTHVWRATSGLCAQREVLLEHYRRRVRLVEERGFSLRMGYEPGTHSRPERVDDLGHEMWRANLPSLDVRHEHNLTPTRWRKEDFRNQRYTEGWVEADGVPGWGITRGRFREMLERIRRGEWRAS